jgi:hypothetical protein
MGAHLKKRRCRMFDLNTYGTLLVVWLTLHFIGDIVRSVGDKEVVHSLTGVLLGCFLRYAGMVYLATQI